MSWRCKLDFHGWVILRCQWPEAYEAAPVEWKQPVIKEVPMAQTERVNCLLAAAKKGEPLGEC